MFLNSKSTPVFCLNTPTPAVPTLDAVLASPPAPGGVSQLPSSLRNLPEEGVPSSGTLPSLVPATPDVPVNCDTILAMVVELIPSVSCPDTKISLNHPLSHLFKDVPNELLRHADLDALGWRIDS